MIGPEDQSLRGGMGNLSELQLGSVRTLIQAASDSAIRDLEATLSSGAERHEAMRMIQGLVLGEAADRRARNLVFSPIAALCQGPRPGGGLSFPAAALGQLWRGLREEAPAEVGAVIHASRGYDCEIPAAALDALCARAAAGLAARSNPGYAAAAATLERSQPGACDALIACLDLAAVARAALERLPDWLGRLNEERAVAARLAFRDAVAVHEEDGGPRLLEMLYAHLEEPWAVLRLISAVMHRPADSYVAGSELACFGERLLDGIDQRLQMLSALDLDRGAEGGAAAGRAVRVAAQVVAEFDESIDLTPDGPWGSRLVRQKRALALAVESRLKSVEREVADALPLQSSGYRNRGARGHPKLNQAPDQRQVNRARALLCFMHEVRTCAERYGFGASWNRAEDALQARLHTYIEDLLEKLRTPGEDDDLERVREYLEVAAEFMGLVSDEKAAQIVRRRVAAAAVPAPEAEGRMTA